MTISSRGGDRARHGALAALGRPPDQDAMRVGPRGEDLRQGLDRIGTPWLGWTMLPTYMITLFSGPTPGIETGRAGPLVLAEVDPG